MIYLGGVSPIELTLYMIGNRQIRIFSTAGFSRNPEVDSEVNSKSWTLAEEINVISRAAAQRYYSDDR